MAFRLLQGNGMRSWAVTRDSEGHRAYKLKLRVETDDPRDGPAEALRTPGLPIVGSWWVVDNDIDLWAWFRPDAQVTPVLDEGEPNKYFDIEILAGTKPPDFARQRCNDTQIEDPLLEPQKVSGTFTRFTEEASFDRFGNPLNNSAFEPFRGAQVEFDQSRPVVRVEQNVASLDLALCTAMVNTVNDAILWGCNRRCIKLSNFSWEKKWYGSCYPYYTRVFEFEINFNTWDRDILDEGTKVLNGRWDATTGDYTLVNIGGSAPDPLDPNHFMQAVDRNGNPITIVLNGRGLPAQATVSGGTNKRLASASVSNGGTGYDLGRELTVTGGTFTTAAVLKVTKTSSSPVSGAITEVKVINRGVYTTPPTNPASTLSGGGATFNLTFENFPGVPTDVGYAHIEKYPETNLLLLGIPIIF